MDIMTADKFYSNSVAKLDITYGSVRSSSRKGEDGVKGLDVGLFYRMFVSVLPFLVYAPTAYRVYDLIIVSRQKYLKQIFIIHTTLILFSFFGGGGGVRKFFLPLLLV